ncbi:unnamed protein product [Boreogadus saida]
MGPTSPSRGGHFLGNNTVIDVLRRQGYEVEHTPAGQPISRRSRPSDPTETEGHGRDATPPQLVPFLHELPGPEQDAHLGGRFHLEGEEDEEDEEALLPPSLDLLQKAERRRMMKKKRRNKQKKQRHRHFNDLWVRIEESAIVQSPPPPLVRIVNGYITVQPPHRGPLSPHEPHHTHSSSSSTSSSTSSLLMGTALVLLLQRSWTLWGL